MSKPPFYLQLPQRLYEILQRKAWLPLVGSLGITIWALYSSVPFIPGSVEKVPPTLSANAWMPTNTPFPLQVTEVVVPAVDMPTWAPPTIEILLPTPTSWFSPTQVIPTEPLQLINPEISQWPVMISDSFDTNQYEWYIGDTDDAFIVGNTLITDGVYRWDLTAVQGVNFRLIPNVDPVTDAYLTVDARRVEGDPGTYGLTFGETEDGQFYYFWINDGTQEFGVAYSSRESGWKTLIDVTKSYSIRPGDINQLGLTATGSYLQFFINNQFVGEVFADGLGEGLVGVAAELFVAGAKAIFEFDNFVLRAPFPTVTPTLAASPTMTPTLMITPSESPLPPTTAPPTSAPQPTKEPTRKPAPKPTKTPAPPGGPTKTPAPP